MTDVDTPAHLIRDLLSTGASLPCPLRRGRSYQTSSVVFGRPQKSLVKMPSKKNENEEQAARQIAYQTYLDDLDADLHRLLSVRRLYCLSMVSHSFKGECTHPGADRNQGPKRPGFRKGSEKTVFRTQDRGSGYQRPSVCHRSPTSPARSHIQSCLLIRSLLMIGPNQSYCGCRQAI